MDHGWNNDHDGNEWIHGWNEHYHDDNWTDAWRKRNPDDEWRTGHWETDGTRQTCAVLIVKDSSGRIILSSRQ